MEGDLLSSDLGQIVSSLDRFFILPFFVIPEIVFWSSSYWNRVLEGKLGFSGSEQGTVTVNSGDGNESLGSTKRMELLDYLSDCKLLKENSSQLH